MLLASDASGVRVSPTPQARAACPLCLTPVIAKCGTQVVHHWAHEASSECDPWKEGESDWHRRWKERFPVEWREITHGPHRADVRSPSGLVVEFQHSSISQEDCAQRDKFWKRCLWIFDAHEAYAADRLRVNRDGDMEWSFPSKTWLTPRLRPWLQLDATRLWRPKGGTCSMWTDPPYPDRPRGIEGEGEIWTVETVVAHVMKRAAVAFDPSLFGG